MKLLFLVTILFTACTKQPPCNIHFSTHVDSTGADTTKIIKP